MNIVELAKQAGLHVAHDSEGHFSGVTNEEIIDRHPDPNKERDRLFREKIFIEVLTPFAALVAAHEREECAKICDHMDSISDYYTLRVELICAQAIRARGQQTPEGGIT